jgi:integrase/recombinase XerC
MLNFSKILSDKEYEALLASLKRLYNKDRRNVILLRLACYTGARASEILNIRGSDLNHDSRTVLIKGLKGSRDREIPLKRDLFADLASLGEHPFPITYARLYAIWQLYRPAMKTFHCLRHTRAFRVYRRTKDLKLIQTLLGHKCLSNTMIYADFLYSNEQLKRGLNIA